MDQPESEEEGNWTNQNQGQKVIGPASIRGIRSLNQSESELEDIAEQPESGPEGIGPTRIRARRALDPN